MAIRETPITRRTMLGAAALAAAAPLAAALPGAGLSPRLLAAARAAYQRHAARITQKGLIAIADYSLHSAAPRFFLYAPESGAVAALRVAHGRGSDPGHTGWLHRFSAEPGSAASSAGAYLAGPAYVGQHGQSRRLIGLDSENETAEARAIVIHGAWYCEAAVLQKTGKLGRSEGCFAFSASDAALVIGQLAPGHLLFSGQG